MSKEFALFIIDQLNGDFSFQHKKMFGEECLFFQGKIIAIINADNQIFIKTNSETLPYFQAKNAIQYTYFSRGKWQKMHYWSIPNEDVEDRDMLLFWFKLATQAI